MPQSIAPTAAYLQLILSYDLLKNRTVLRAATKGEIEALEREGYSLGWQDGLMYRDCTPPYSAHSVQGRKYLAGHKAGKQHREFLNARGMKHVCSSVEKTGAGWRWTVLVEGQIVANGCEKTRKQAEGVAESVSIDKTFSPNSSDRNLRNLS
ncbi:TPA: hypothetical protein L4559_003447 [Pseudomonas aeruginosa]|nr:hypothetical protein [Pseudomonas aeruginosa]